MELSLPQHHSLRFGARHPGTDVVVVKGGHQNFKLSLLAPSIAVRCAPIGSQPQFNYHGTID